MGGSQKSKRVTWASDVNLCQVKLFLSEDSPSQVGLSTQDHLQAKIWQANAGGLGPDDNLPPGFEGIQPVNPLSVKLSQIPLVKWKRPPRFEINIAWRVVAGEESKEVETQNVREMRVLEAIYPRPSAIPLDPSALIGVEEDTTNSQPTPVVPITPIEDEDASFDIMPTSQQSAVAISTPNVSDPNIVATVQAALSSVNDQGNLIDPELLVKILGNPQMIERLIANRAASSSGQQHLPTSIGINNFSSSTSPATFAQPRPGIVAASMATSNGPFYPPSMTHIPNLRTSVPDVMSAPSPVPVKDVNYYKSLIQQHGGEKPQFGHQSNQDPMNMMMKPRETKPKIMKPCMYFSSPRGCRNGANCSFQHELVPAQKPNSADEGQSNKRMKLDREITGL